MTVLDRNEAPDVCGASKQGGRYKQVTYAASPSQTPVFSIHTDSVSASLQCSISFKVLRQELKDIMCWCCSFVQFLHLTLIQFQSQPFDAKGILGFSCILVHSLSLCQYSIQQKLKPFELVFCHFTMFCPLHILKLQLFPSLMITVTTVAVVVYCEVSGKDTVNQSIDILNIQESSFCTIILCCKTVIFASVICNIGLLA